MFDLPAEAGAPLRVPDAVAAELERTLTAHSEALLTEMSARDGHLFDPEMVKLDRWAENRLNARGLECIDVAKVR